MKILMRVVAATEEMTYWGPANLFAIFLTTSLTGVVVCWRLLSRGYYQALFSKRDGTGYIARN
ncbi:MAG TPA: hypothetical protein VGC39_11275 [Candidatus Methylacidiphilales bacterium]